MGWPLGFLNRNIKRAAFGVGVAILAGFGVHAQDSETLTLDQARAIATQALRAGDFETARRLAMGLLQADAQDAYAYAILTSAHARLDNPTLARQAARLTYKYSENPEQSYSAARTAGQIAFNQKRYTAAQIWLRKAALYADDPRKTQQVARDYGQLRRANPFSFKLSVSATPSDNVNNGSDAVLDIINGVPQGGVIGASSRALSGIVGTTDVSLRYRLKQTKKARTSLSARVFTRRVALSSQARTIAPNVSNQDLASTYGAIGLSHTFGLQKAGNFATFEGTGGKAWSSGRAQYVFGRLGLSPSYRLSDSTRLVLKSSYENRWSDISAARDSAITKLSATLQHKLQIGNRLSVGISLQDITSEATNASYASGVVNVNYSLGKQIGPMKLSAGVSLGHTDYSTFRATTMVAGGRQDQSVYGDVTMLFTDYDVAGFAPSLRIRTGKKTSNVSRFNTRELSVSLGIQSKF